MNNTYSSIELSTGFYIAGLYKVIIAPREWLTETIDRDFNTGKVIKPVTLLALQFTPDTYEFSEKPKSGKQGPYFEVSIQGTANNISPKILQTLETYRYHEMIAILYDKKKRLKVVGNKENGLVFTFTNKESTTQGGLQLCEIDLNMLSEQAAPFYEV